MTGNAVAAVVRRRVLGPLDADDDCGTAVAVVALGCFAEAFGATVLLLALLVFADAGVQERKHQQCSNSPDLKRGCKDSLNDVTIFVMPDIPALGTSRTALTFTADKPPTI